MCVSGSCGALCAAPRAARSNARRSYFSWGQVKKEFKKTDGGAVTNWKDMKDCEIEYGWQFKVRGEKGWGGGLGGGGGGTEMECFS